MSFVSLFFKPFMKKEIEKFNKENERLNYLKHKSTVKEWKHENHLSCPKCNKTFKPDIPYFYDPAFITNKALEEKDKDVISFKEEHIRNCMGGEG